MTYPYTKTGGVTKMITGPDEPDHPPSFRFFEAVCLAVGIGALIWIIGWLLIWMTGKF